MLYRVLNQVFIPYRNKERLTILLTSKINWLLDRLPHSPNPILVVGTNLNELIPAVTQHHHPVTFAHFSEEPGQNFGEINFINSLENITLCQNSYTDSPSLFTNDL
ncbi:MAG: hypothetical protein BWK79_19880 [Beggiatoa sp. IS2]|nr:MAG: hypothetical protein BWK79_19880 [Beggiatoa sp. IS2]